MVKFFIQMVGCLIAFQTPFIEALAQPDHSRPLFQHGIKSIKEKKWGSHIVNIPTENGELRQEVRWGRDKYRVVEFNREGQRLYDSVKSFGTPQKIKAFFNYKYDRQGRLKKKLEKRHDTLFKLTRIERIGDDTVQMKIKRSYNDRKQLLKRYVTKYRRDKHGNVTKKLNIDGELRKKAEYSFDEDGRKRYVQVYDRNDSLKADTAWGILTYPNGNVHKVDVIVNHYGTFIDLWTGEEKDQETIRYEYEYNKMGDLVKKDGPGEKVLLYNYEYDERGNWTKCTRWEKGNKLKTKVEWVREIEYW